MSSINLGGFNTSNGSTTALGFLSNLDGDALIEAILSAKQTAIDDSKAEVDVNKEKISAIGELQTLLDRLKTTSNFLRSPPGSLNQSNDFFKHTITSLTSSTSVSASTYLSVTSEAGATINSYSIENISLAAAHQIRKDGFTSKTASVVGNASVTDNYQVSLGTISGSVLNSTTPITFANDVKGTVATSAVLEVVFGTENKFDATDELKIGATTITFGGTGGSDINISGASTLDDKIDAIVNYLNTVATGAESTYTYSRNSTGVLTITQDTAGTIASTGNDITVSANFAKGATDTTQTVQIGKNYKNNASASGSVGRSNGLVSGTVAQNGVDGYAAATKATINIVIANNDIDAGDTITFGSTTATFGTDITVGADLAETLDNINNFFNNLTSGAEAGYKFENNGTDTITVTRETYGSGANLAINADFSLGADTANTLAIGSQLASNNPAGGALNALAADGVNRTSVTDASTTYITSLSGAVTITGATYTAGSSAANGFTSNTVRFTATVNGQTYTSNPIELDGGTIGGLGDGDNGLGNRVPAGTVITFVKDGDSDTTLGTSDVTFSLVTGDEKIINNAGNATTYATEVNTWLNVTNSVSITQSPTVPPFRAGTFSLGGVNITLNEGDNLQVIKSKINSVSATSGVQADIVQIGDDNFSLVLKSTETGVKNKIFEFADGDVGDGSAGTIQIGLSNVTFTQSIAAVDASIELDGQTITRATNNFNDVIDKVTFTLKAATPLASPPVISLNIESDTALVKSGITDFLTAYNDLKLFISEQTERDENNVLVETAILGDESILRDVLSSVDAQLSKTIAGISDSGFNSLFEVGIDLIDFPGNDETPKTKNIFVIDEDKFDAAIASNFQAVRDVFAFKFEANSPDLGVFSRSNKTTLTNYVLDIDNTRAANDRVRVLKASDNSFLFNATLDGNTIKGNAGTTLEGLVLIYTGDGTDRITVNQSAGVSDGLYNLLDGYLESSGFVEDAIESFKTENDRILERIERDNITIEIERKLLVEQFTRLEAVISSANNTLSFLQAQSQANSDNRR
jgi:flagellar hook-associated protein 2